MCSEPEIPRVLFRIPRCRDWADIFRDASLSHRPFSTPISVNIERLPGVERSLFPSPSSVVPKFFLTCSLFSPKAKDVPTFFLIRDVSFFNCDMLSEISTWRFLIIKVFRWEMSNGLFKCL